MMQPLVYFPPNSEGFSYMGRFDASAQTEYTTSFPNGTIAFSVDSRIVEALFYDYAYDASQPNYIEVYINDSVYKTIKLSAEKKSYMIFSSAEKKMREFKLVKRTEGQVGNIGFAGIKVEKKSSFERVEFPSKKVLFVGNSITCGYGNEAEQAEAAFCSSTQNASMSFAAIAARELNASFHTIAFSGKGMSRNYGDTVFLQDCIPDVFLRTLAMKPSAHWNHNNFVPDVIVINIGTNDFSPPIGINQKIYVQQFTQFLDFLHKTYTHSDIVLLVSQMLSGADRDLQKNLLLKIKENSQQNNQVHVFELSEQGSLGYGADWHPNIAQHKKNAQELVEFLQHVL